MKSDIGYFRLGLFIIIGTLILVGGVILFSTAAFTEDALIVETVTTESVQGLDVGAPVKFRGVRIGHVRKIDLAYIRYKDKIVGKEQNVGNAVILELGIRPEGLPAGVSSDNIGSFQTAVTNGLRARIASSSLTGPPYVELVFLDPKTNPPFALPWRTDQPYLPAVPSTFVQFVDSAQGIVTSIRDADVGKVIGHVDDLILKTNQSIDALNIPDLRVHALALLDELRDSNKRVQEILKNANIDAALADLASASSSLKQSAQSPALKKFIDDLPEISSRLKHTIDQIDTLTSDENIKKSLANINQASQGANEALADIRRLAHAANALLASEQQDISSIISNFRSAAENAAAITEDAKANPSRLIFGQPPTPLKGDKK